jgi:hypothetical protein
MLEVDGLVAFVVFGLWLYALYDVITTEESLVRNLPKGVWLLLVLVLFDIGALAWLLLGRPQAWQLASPPSTKYRTAERPPVDDSSLDDLSPVVRHREEQARLKLWEEQLKRREDEIRQRELGIAPENRDPRDEAGDA